MPKNLTSIFEEENRALQIIRDINKQHGVYRRYESKDIKIYRVGHTSNRYSESMIYYKHE